MNKYIIYCTPEQTERALELGASIILFCKDYMHGHINYMGSPISIGHYVLIHKDLYYAPTTEQMIGWLIKEHGILPVIDMANSMSFKHGFAAMIKMENNIKRFVGIYPTPKEATLAAIDAALEYLINNKSNMEQTEYKFEITFKSSYTKEELGDMVEVWLKRSLENMLDQQCELESFTLKAYE